MLSLRLFIGCKKPHNSSLRSSNIHTDIKLYKNYLIDRNEGLCQIQNSSVTDFSFGIATIHGSYPREWPEKGFE